MATGDHPPGGAAAVATLVATHGTTPKAPGAHMWVGADGHIVGSVTIGGCVDARVVEEAARVVATGTPLLLDMSLGDEDAWALGMTCGGRVEVLIEPLLGGAGVTVAEAQGLARDAVRAGQRAAIVTTLAPAVVSRLVVREDGWRTGSLGAPALDQHAEAVARDVLASGASGVHEVAAGGVTHRVYIERHAPPLTLLVVGATHVAVTLAQLAHHVGLRTVIVDGRVAYASRARFPVADRIEVGMPSEVVARVAPGPETLAVLLAHDYKYDLPVLRTLLATDVAYVGLLGSRRRGRALLAFLAEEGVAPEQLQRVHVPAGLDIGARSADEIALSVLAEALAVQRGRGGAPLRGLHAADAS